MKNPDTYLIAVPASSYLAIAGVVQITQGVVEKKYELVGSGLVNLLGSGAVTVFFDQLRKARDARNLLEETLENLITYQTSLEK